MKPCFTEAQDAMQSILKTLMCLSLTDVASHAIASQTVYEMVSLGTRIHGLRKTIIATRPGNWQVLFKLMFAYFLFFVQVRKVLMHNNIDFIVILLFIVKIAKWPAKKFP